MSEGGRERERERESQRVREPSPWSAEVWAQLVRSKVKPFLQKEFPGRTSFQLLLDGEKLLRAPPAQVAFRAVGITLLPNWPPYSPDLNPQVARGLAKNLN